MNLLNTLFYILIFPGFLFTFFIGLLLAGVDRKLVARLQRRMGPPLAQPIYDFFKLLGKSHIVPRGASRKAFLMAPVIGLLAVITIPLFIPVFGFEFMRNSADMIVLIYLLTIPAVSLIMGGSSSGSPFAGVGISREMVTMLSYELPLVVILLAVGAKAGFALDGNVTFSLMKIHQYQASQGLLLFHWTMLPAAVAFLLLIPAEVGSVPFDVAEAETEICEGPLVEYSGFYLGVYKLTQAIKIFVMASLFTALFLGGKGLGNVTGIPAADLLLNTLLLIIVAVLIVAVSISFPKANLARIKVEQTLRFFWTIPTGLALLSLLLVYLRF